MARVSSCKMTVLFDLSSLWQIIFAMLKRSLTSVQKELNVILKLFKNKTHDDYGDNRKKYTYFMKKKKLHSEGSTGSYPEKVPDTAGQERQQW